MMTVAAFTRYGARAASTRQRFLQYLPHLNKVGIEVRHHALLGDDYVDSLATGDPYSKAKVARAYVDRLEQLLRARDADLYWIYVELLPFVPALFERLATTGKRIVYDFDDAFFHTYDQSANPVVRTILADKHAALLKSAAACCCGNSYLRDFAVHHCKDSIVLPTVVDTEAYRPVASASARRLTVGWIGSPTTWPNVRPLISLLAELVQSHGIRVCVVGAGKDAENDAFPGLELVEWSEATEVANVQSMDIGIMPLPDRPFERGKSGYKLVQYMACGLPVIASPVGVNSEIVDHGNNGYLASSESEWRDALVRLIDDKGLRCQFGRAGRRRVEDHYSLQSQAPRLIQVLRRAVNC